MSVERFWEVDFLRGAAVLLMVLFNWSYALRFLDIVSVVSFENYFYWEIFPLLIAGSFMFIAGISLSLSWNRFKEKDPTSREKWKKYGVRGAKIFTLGLGITLVTWLTFPENFVFFGILHLIGAVVLLSPLVIDSPRKSFLLAAVILSASFLIHLDSSSIFLSSIGLSAPGMRTFDYFPFVPWASVVFMGNSVGHYLYPNHRRRYPISRPETLGNLIKLGEYLGRNSLVIYLLHQPVLVVLLMLLGYSVL